MTPRARRVLLVLACLALALVSYAAWAQDAGSLDVAGASGGTVVGTLALVGTGVLSYLQWSRARTEKADEAVKHTAVKDRAERAAKDAVEKRLAALALEQANARAVEAEAEAARIKLAVSEAVSPLLDRIAELRIEYRDLSKRTTDAERQLAVLQAQSAALESIGKTLVSVEAQVARIAGGHHG